MRNVYIESHIQENLSNIKRGLAVETRIQKVNKISYLLAPLLQHPEISIPSKRQIINSILFQPYVMEAKHGHSKIVNLL
jgi:hypothetical protein